MTHNGLHHDGQGQRPTPGPKTKPVSHYSVEDVEWHGETYYRNKNGSWFQPYIRHGVRKFKYFKQYECTMCNTVFFGHKQSTIAARHFCSAECKSAGNSGALNRTWIGDVCPVNSADPDSYLLEAAPGHPNARRGRVLQHRLVIERHLGRFLRSDEFVHHIDCDKQNNDLENLVVLDHWRHNVAHAGLENCVKDLFAMGVLAFDRDASAYVVVPREVDDGR